MNSIKRTFNFIRKHPLAGRYPLRAFWKFIWWQARSSFKKGFLIEPFIGGTRVVARKGLNSITGSIYSGLFEFEDMSYLLHFLNKEDIFFDVGANAGSYTILAAGVKGAFCVSFEPIPASFEILNKNIALNNIQNLVKAEQVGVSNQKGHLTFTTDQDAGNHVLVNEDKNDSLTTTIPVVPLNQYSSEFKPALIKIDVEGYETQVINGADSILSDPLLNSILIELNGSGEKYGFDEKEIHNKLVKYGFNRYKYDPFNRLLSSRDDFGDLNTLYIKDLSFAENRVKNSKPFKIFGEWI